MKKQVILSEGDRIASYGVFLESIGKIEDANKHYLKSVHLDSAMGMAIVASKLLLQKKYQEAFKYFKKLCDKGICEHYFDAAYCAEKMGLLEKSIQYHKSFIIAVSDGSIAYLNDHDEQKMKISMDTVSKYYHDGNNIDEIYKFVLRVHNDRYSTSCFMIDFGILYLKNNKIDLALKTFLKIEEFNNSNTCYHISLCYFKLKNLELGMYYLIRFLELKERSNDWDVNFLVSFAIKKAKKYSDILRLQHIHCFLLDNEINVFFDENDNKLFDRFNKIYVSKKQALISNEQAYSNIVYDLSDNNYTIHLEKLISFMENL